MKIRWSLGLLVSTLSLHAAAQDEGVNVGAVGNVGTTAPAPMALGQSDRFAAPNGQTGAGLSISSPEGSKRAYGELSFFTRHESDEAGGLELSSYVWSLSAIVGGGYKIAPDIELEAMLPLAFVAYGYELSIPALDVSQDEDEIGAAIGNLHFGVNFLRAEGNVRMKFGGAVQWGPWTIDPSTNFGTALVGAAFVHGAQDIGLWAPETVSLVAPARFEVGDQIVGSGDAALGLHVPTDGDDVELTIQLFPGFGIYANPSLLIGARLPIIIVPTESGSDQTFVALEPYARLDLDQAFLNTRFTLNLDDPLGFSFDEGKYWGWHIGGGGVF